MEAARIIIAPVITEKSMDEAGRGRFTFVVDKDASKTEIKKAVEDQFKVNVVSIATLIAKGKKRRVGKRRTPVVLPALKKAIVKLANGQRIDLFEVQKEEPSKTA